MNSISVSSIIREAGAPIYGLYRIRDIALNEDGSEYLFRLADASGAIQARINAFIVAFDDPGEVQDAVMRVTGRVASTGHDFEVVVDALTEVTDGVYGHISTLPREVAVRRALPAFDFIVSRILAMESESTRRYCELALCHPKVYDHYFRIGASRSSHHSEAGGLAIHVAEMILELDQSALMQRLPDWRRDLAVAAAIVHDLPKAIHFPQPPQKYDPDKETERLMSSLSVPFHYMDAVWPKGAAHLRKVLNGFPRAAAAQTVEAVALWGCDRLSAVASAEASAFASLAVADALEVTATFGPNCSRTYHRPSPPPDVATD